MSRVYETSFTDEESVIAEETSRDISFVVKNSADQPVAGSTLTSMVATLYVKTSGSIINERDRQDILNINGGAVDESGVGILQLDPEDNVILEQTTKKEEDHELLIEWEEESGQQGKHLIHLRVANLTKVPAA